MILVIFLLFNLYLVTYFLPFFWWEYMLLYCCLEVWIMALMFNFHSEHDFIVNELSKFGEDSYTILTIMDFVKTDCVSDLMAELNDKFGSTIGNRAYPS